MIRNVLFISNETGFLAKALIKRVADVGFKVESTGVDLRVLLENGETKPYSFVIYFDGFVQEYDYALKKIGKLMMEASNRYSLYLIGTIGELEYAYSMIPRHFISKAFTRPVDPNDIIAALLDSDPKTDVRRKRVLLVDDDPQLLRLMKNWLADTYDVYMESSGKAALEFFKKEGRTADLILLDYEMPELSGLETFQQLKEGSLTSDIPVIFLTAKDDKETVMKVLAAHPEKYVLKTVSKKELLKTLSEFFWKVDK